MRIVALTARRMLWLGLPLGALLGWLAASGQERPTRAKPFVRVADTISPQGRKYLESLPDPATLPEWPAPDDSTGWKRAWEKGEADSEAAVKEH